MAYTIPFIIRDPKPGGKQAMLDMQRALQEEFQAELSLNVARTTYLLGFDIKDFDPEGHKVFATPDFESAMIGPPGRQRKYSQPVGWERLGLNCINKYTDPTWLAPFGHAGNWFRAFHGAARGAHKLLTNDDKKKIMRDIAAEGLNGANNACGGEEGVSAYLSPEMDYAELYAGTYPVEFQGDDNNETIQMKLAFQIAVNPNLEFVQAWDGERHLHGPGRVVEYPETLGDEPVLHGRHAGKTCKAYGSELVEWIVPAGKKGENLRPYGILFRPADYKVEQSGLGTSEGTDDFIPYDSDSDDELAVLLPRRG